MMRRKKTLEDPAADKSSEDAIITTSRIMLSLAATKVIEKEQHHSTRGGWRSATWNEQETDKCWEEVTSILMGELVDDVPTTYVSENHGCVAVHRGTNFPSSGSDAKSNETGAFGCTFWRTDHATNQTDVVRWRDDGKTQFVHRNEMETYRIQMGVKKANMLIELMARLWKLKLGSKNTPTLITKATGRGRDIDETLMQHDVRAFRDDGTSFPAVKSSIQLETWLYRRQARLAACMSEHISGSRRSDEGNCVEHWVKTQRTSVLRCEAIAD